MKTDSNGRSSTAVRTFFDGLGRKRTETDTYMQIGISAFASSSAGNCYLIKSENSAIILDAGISYKKINDDLAAEGLLATDIKAVLITHEHSDHVKSLPILAKKAKNAKVYATKGTFAGIGAENIILEEGRACVAVPGESFLVGDITVTPFNVSHDTREPAAFYFEKGGDKIAVVTDTGYVTDEVYEAVKDADILVIESNHERNILLYGSYPYQVKMRILSDHGHLSNEAAAECISRALAERYGSDCGTANTSCGRPLILLAHLSCENNTPAQALITARNYLEERGFIEGEDYDIEVLKRDECSSYMHR